MEVLQMFQGIEWLNVGKIIGYYGFYFLFYVLLIQSTIIASIKGVSSIFYKTETNMGTEVMAASVLWSVFILLHM